MFRGDRKDVIGIWVRFFDFFIIRFRCVKRLFFY